MGRYIQGPIHGKANYIKTMFNGETITSPPASFNSIPEGKALIVVCNNGPFEAAGYAYDQVEFEEFTRPDDPRPREYILIDKAVAENNS